MRACTYISSLQRGKEKLYTVLVVSPWILRSARSVAGHGLLARPGTYPEIGFVGELRLGHSAGGEVTSCGGYRLLAAIWTASWKGSVSRPGKGDWHVLGRSSALVSSE